MDTEILTTISGLGAGEIRKAREIGHKGWGKHIWHACEICGKGKI